MTKQEKMQLVREALQEIETFVELGYDEQTYADQLPIELIEKAVQLYKKLMRDGE